MTANELIQLFNEKFGFAAWPKVYEVDAETYANCCQAVFDECVNNYDLYDIQSNNINSKIYYIALGTKGNGLMFKNVELFFRKKK